MRISLRVKTGLSTTFDEQQLQTSRQFSLSGPRIPAMMSNITGLPANQREHARGVSLPVKPALTMQLPLSTKSPKKSFWLIPATMPS